MAWTTNDEELLILSDDADIWSDFVLDEQMINNNGESFSNDEPISFDSDIPSFDISLWDDSKKDENEMLWLSNDLSQETQESGDNDYFWFSSWETTQKEESKDIEESDLSSKLNIENIPLNQAVWTTWTMADILDEAIAKFSKREDVISSSILSREEHIKSLREQIASLESAVNDDNEEVIRLNTEKQAIVKNRKALEKMKELPVTTK